MTGDAHGQLHRRGAFHNDRFGNHRHRLLRAAEFGGGAGRVEVLDV